VKVLEIDFSSAAAWPSSFACDIGSSLAKMHINHFKRHYRASLGLYHRRYHAYRSSLVNVETFVGPGVNNVRNVYEVNVGRP